MAGPSRKTGYKIFERYEECGLEGQARRFMNGITHMVTSKYMTPAATISAAQIQIRESHD